MRFANKLLARLVVGMRRHKVSLPIKFISLNSILLTALLTLFQFYLVANRFRLLKEMSINSAASFAAAFLTAADTQFYQTNFTRSLIINTCLLTLSLVFTILFCLVNPIRLGVYSHDNFKLGKSFDKKSVKFQASKNQGGPKTTTRTSVSTISDGVMSSTSSDDMTANKSSSKQPLTSKSTSSFINDCVSLDASCRYNRWIKKLPPLGSLFHIAAALCLLVAELQINSKRIQMGQKPLGDTFSTKMDFLVGEPIVRLKSFNTYNKNDGKLTTNNDEYALSDVIYSKDDFSLFNNFKASREDDHTTSSGSGSKLSSSSSSFWMFLFFNSKHSISLSYLNLLIALTIYSVKIAQTFWYTSYLFTVMVFLYTSLATLVVAVSFASFEILFKSNNLKKIAKHLILFSSSSDSSKQSQQLNTTTTPNETDYFNLLYGKINFNLGHDIIITLIYITTNIMLVGNCYVFVLYGYKKFDKFKIKVESIIWSYFLNHTKQGSESNMSLIESDDTSTSSDNSSSSHNINSRVMASNQSSELTRQLRFLRLYTENLTSSLLFLIYSILRSLYLYESYVVFKYTNDSLFIVNIFVELLALVVWALVLILITVKTKWSFRINSSYKLVYWNWIHYENARRRGGSGGSNSRHKLSTNNKLDDESNELVKILRLGSVLSTSNLVDGMKRHSMALLSTNHKTNDSGEMIIKTISEKTNVASKSSNKSSINCLLVRDDSILNRSSSQTFNNNNRRNSSSHLSSSSITEVSSLMPSAFFSTTSNVYLPTNPAPPANNNNNNNSNNSSRRSFIEAHANIIMSSSASSKFTTESGIFGSNPLNSDVTNTTNHGAASNDDYEDKSTPGANRSKKKTAASLMPSSSSSSSASSFKHSQNYSNPHRMTRSSYRSQQQQHRFLEGANFIIDDDEYELGPPKQQHYYPPQQRSYSCRKYPPLNRHTVYTIGESLEQNPSSVDNNNNDGNSSTSGASSSRFTKTTTTSSTTTNREGAVKNAHHVLLTGCDSTSFNSATVDSGHESIDSPPLLPAVASAATGNHPNSKFSHSRRDNSLATNRRLSSSLDTRC